MESIIINGKRMVSAHTGKRGEIGSLTGPIRTSNAFPRCKSTWIKSNNTKALLNSIHTRRNLALVGGNGKILTPKEKREQFERVFKGKVVSKGTGIDPSMEVGNRDIDS